jgi:hypothetical protein
LDVHDIQDERRFVDFLHHGQEFGIDVLESRAFNREEVLDVSAAREDAFQIYPLALNVNPNV